jgi:hypothetical protein
MSACSQPAGGMVMEMPMMDPPTMEMPMMPMPDGASVSLSDSVFTLRSPDGVFSCLQDLEVGAEGGMIDKWLCSFAPASEPLCPDMNLLVDSAEAFFHCVQNGPRVECRVPAGMRSDQVSTSPALIQCGAPTMPLPLPTAAPAPPATPSPAAAPAFVLSSSGQPMYACTESLGEGEWKCDFKGTVPPTVSCEQSTYAVFGQGDFCTHHSDGSVVCSLMSSSPSSTDVGTVEFMC